MNCLYICCSVVTSTVRPRCSQALFWLSFFPLFSATSGRVFSFSLFVGLRVTRKEALFHVRARESPDWLLLVSF